MTDDYAADYDRALRYGRLRTVAEYGPLVRGIAARVGRHTKPYRSWQPEMSDILADFLGDEGDPREEILRHNRDGAPAPRPAVPPGHAYEPYHDTLVLTDRDAKPAPWDYDGVGQIRFTVAHLPTTDQKFLRTNLYFPIEENQGFWREANLTPEEGRDFADKFPDGHREHIHAFIDKHFPPAPAHPAE